MAANRQIRETPQFHIGSPVRTSEGTVGKIERVVVDPDHGRIVDLVVSLGGLGSTPAVVLPAQRVTYADAEGAESDLSPDEIRRLPEYEEVRFRPAGEGWPGLPEYTPDVVLFWAPSTAVGAFVPHNVVPEPNVAGVRNVPPGSVAVTEELDVTCGDHVVGHVDRVLVDEDEECATHVVVRSGVLGRERHVVPVSHVREVTETRVDLDCHGRGLDEFPRFEG